MTHIDSVESLLLKYRRKGKAEEDVRTIVSQAAKSIEKWAHMHAGIKPDILNTIYSPLEAG
jgi:hypothetical protein